MAQRLVIDFETRSAADLKKLGAEAYAMAPSTDILCLAYALDDAPVAIWAPGMPDPTDALEHIASGRTVVAHNVPFELAIWRHVVAPHWPRLALEQLDDTMVRAQVLGLPAGLEDLAAWLKLPVQKDMAGNALMKKMAKPRKPRKGEIPGPDGFIWVDSPADRARLAAYCATDVEAQRLVDKALPPLAAAERDLWLMDLRINLRGIQLDLASAKAGLDVCAAVTDRLNAEVQTVTGGAVTKLTQTARMQTWLRTQGLDTTTFRKQQVVDLAASSPDLLYSEDVARLLAIRLEAGKASTKKLNAMLRCACPDGRARNQFAHHAATTGRAAGRLIQVQNLPRPALKDRDITGVLEALKSPHATDLIEFGYGPPVDMLKSCLRALLISRPGHEFVGGDFANIEGRVLAWLADEWWKLDAFRAYDTIGPDGKRSGPDLYVLAYARAFGVPVETVTDDWRQIGKVMELSLGYAGGVKAFKSMGANYGVAIVEDGERPPPGSKQVLTGDQADEIKKAWRRAHPAVVDMWRYMERDAIAAVQAPGKSFGNKVRWQMNGQFLYCRLPSGRLLSYPRARVVVKAKEIVDRKTGETFIKVGEVLQSEGWISGRTGAKIWGLNDLYGGLLAENVTQAVARDLLYGAMLRMEARGWPIVLHVHDDARAEVPTGSVDLADVARVMTELPPWAKGLPVAVASVACVRFGK